MIKYLEKCESEKTNVCVSIYLGVEWYKKDVLDSLQLKRSTNLNIIIAIVIIKFICKTL